MQLDEATDAWGIKVERVEMLVFSALIFFASATFRAKYYDTKRLLKKSKHKHTYFLISFSKDVRLPIQLQRAMAAEAEAAREARAKVIAAEGEQKASRALREASEVIGDSPAALQLRYLQVNLSTKGKNTEN